MIPKNIIQIILGISRIVGRAVGKAIKEEYTASQQASKARSSSSSSNNSESFFTDTSFGITLEEAKLILNIENIDDIEKINKRYSHLFEINEKSNGGSLYLQSKVYRAKERIDQENEKLKI